MLRAIKYTLWTIWIVFAVGLGMTIGAMQGWEHHGWMGATALGLSAFVSAGWLHVPPTLALNFSRPLFRP